MSILPTYGMKKSNLSIFSHLQWSTIEMQHLLHEPVCKWGHFEWAKPISKILLDLWIEILYVKKVEIFQKRYCECLWVKGMQSCGLSNFENDLIIQDSNLGCTCLVRVRQRYMIFFRSPTLTACNFAALWPTETHRTSFEISKPLLLI